MRKTKVAILGVLAAAMTVVPISASASAPASTDTQAITVAGDTPDAQRFVWPGACRHAWTHMRETAIIYAQPNDNAQILGLVSPAGVYVACRALALGGRYADCGGTNANGWILIPLSPAPKQGWIHSTCTEDPDPLPPI